jgi:hypothetical protein
MRAPKWPGASFHALASKISFTSLSLSFSNFARDSAVVPCLPSAFGFE